MNQETDLLTIQVTIPRYPVMASELANYILEQLDNYNKNFRHYKARDQKNFILQPNETKHVTIHKTEFTEPLCVKIT